jgi:hypothetical protein
MIGYLPMSENYNKKNNKVDIRVAAAKKLKISAGKYIVRDFFFIIVQTTRLRFQRKSFIF